MLDKLAGMLELCETWSTTDYRKVTIAVNMDTSGLDEGQLRRSTRVIEGVTKADSLVRRRV